MSAPNCIEHPEEWSLPHLERWRLYEERTNVAMEKLLEICPSPPYLYHDLTQPRDVSNKPPHISTRRQAIAAIRAEQDAIFASRDKTRGTHDIDALTCAVMIRDKAARLINQWRAGKEMDGEEFLDVANYSVIALLLARSQWTLPWEDE